MRAAGPVRALVAGRVLAAAEQRVRGRLALGPIHRVRLARVDEKRDARRLQQLLKVLWDLQQRRVADRGDGDGVVDREVEPVAACAA